MTYITPFASMPATLDGFPFGTPLRQVTGALNNVLASGEPTLIGLNEYTETVWCGNWREPYFVFLYPSGAIANSGSIVIQSSPDKNVTYAADAYSTVAATGWAWKQFPAGQGILAFLRFRNTTNQPVRIFANGMP